MQKQVLAIKFLPNIRSLLISNKYNFKLTTSHTDYIDTLLEEYENDKFKILLHLDSYAEEIIISGDVNLIENDIETILKNCML